MFGPLPMLRLPLTIRLSQANTHGILSAPQAAGKVPFSRSFPLFDKAWPTGDVD
jgi:hypothetical protein